VGARERAALTLLSDTIPSASPALLNQIARIQFASGQAPDIALKRALDLSTAPADAIDAVSMAVHAEKWDLVRLALDHSVADARQVALETLGARESTPFGPSLLALIDDKGSRVRRALVGLLSERQHPRHHDALLKICRDGWSNTERFHDEPPSYPIAREAIDAIGR
jgi:HEAT repeat protein